VKFEMGNVQTEMSKQKIAGKIAKSPSFQVTKSPVTLRLGDLGTMNRF